MYILVSLTILIIGILMLPLRLQINIEEKNTYLKIELCVMLFGYILYQQKQEIDCLKRILTKLQKANRNDVYKNHRTRSSEIMPILLHIGKWEKFSWYSEIGLDDASQTAIASGIIQGIQEIFRRVFLQHTSCRADVCCRPNFNNAIIRNNVICIVGFRLGNIIKEIVKDHVKKKWRESI